MAKAINNGSKVDDRILLKKYMLKSSYSVDVGFQDLLPDLWCGDQAVEELR